MQTQFLIMSHDLAPWVRIETILVHIFPTSLPELSSTIKSIENPTINFPQLPLSKTWAFGRFGGRCWRGNIVVWISLGGVWGGCWDACGTCLGRFLGYLGGFVGGWYYIFRRGITVNIIKQTLIRPINIYEHSSLFGVVVSIPSRSNCNTREINTC